MDALVKRRPEGNVIPARAGISTKPAVTYRPEIPAFAGMTRRSLR
jgi:hypothetical protein